MVSVLGTFSRFCLHCASLARLSSFHRRSASASPSMERSPSSRNPITSFWKVASTSEASAKSFWTLSLSFVAAPWQGERGQSLVPSPAPSSRLYGIPLTLHHSITPSPKNSDHSTAVKGPGWALPLTAAPHLVSPSRKVMFFTRAKGDKPPMSLRREGAGDRGCPGMILDLFLLPG